MFKSFLSLPDRKDMDVLLPHTPLSSVSDLPPSLLCSSFLAVMHEYTTRLCYFILQVKGKKLGSEGYGVSVCIIKRQLECVCVCLRERERESGASLYQPLQAAALCIVPSVCCPSSLQQCLTV